MKKLAIETGIAVVAGLTGYLVVAGSAYLLGYYPGQPTKTFGATPNVDPAVINAYLAQWGGAIVLVAVTLYRNLSPAWQAVVVSILNITEQVKVKIPPTPQPAPERPVSRSEYVALHDTLHELVAKVIAIEKRVP